MKDIAIIGLAGRFPEAGNLAEFRHNLMQGKDSVRDLSFERKSATTLALDKTFMEIGYMEDIDKFDHAFFNISRAEAENMDPHQRLLMEVVYETIESAGYNIDFFNGSETAVFIGDTEQEYYRLADRFDPLQLTGSTSATTAGRIARFFNFRGNAAMVDTACSSSLLAVHMACNELMMGEADYALAAGVRFILFPAEKNGAAGIGIMSADGRTRSFSAKAEGSGAGEAVGSVLLKPLDKALADGDIIYAVIKATAVNQDAQLSGSLTAPSSQAQAEVIRKAWKKGQIDPGTVSYIEAHGSGTKLGDPIEIAGIDLAFKGFTGNKHFCAVSAVKSNIGHTGGAAGISGLIKTVLSLYHKELYPIVHFDQPNPFIDFKNSVVYINTSYRSWEAPYPRRAGVSSFGLSGTNCHVLLEEAPYSGETPGEPPSRMEPLHPAEYIFNFSARTANSLKTWLKIFSDDITSKDTPALSDNNNPSFPEISIPVQNSIPAQTSIPSLADISYTLNLGRKHYPHRASVIASSKGALVQKIKSITLHNAQKATKKIIFLFSGDSTGSDQLLASASDNHPEFKKYVDQCAAFYTIPNPAISRFVLQYALYRFLEEKGLTTENLLGIGNGDLVVAAILNELSLEEAIARCTDDSELSLTDLNKRLISLIERETGDDKLAFVEIGTPGCLSKGLQQLNYPDAAFLYSVIHVDNSPLDIIQALYLQQYAIDWSKYYARSDNNHTRPHDRRLPLPAYHFEKVRCWLKASLQPSLQPLIPENSPAPASNSKPVGIPENGSQAPVDTRSPIIPGDWSEMQKKIAAIWIDVLRLEELSLEDDFFRLGGHSLMATKVISAIEKEFGIKLIFKDIFTFATVKTLAKGVEELLANGAQKAGYHEIQPAAPQAYYPLSDAQRRLWLIAQVNENTVAYNLPAALLLEGPLETDRLEAAFRSLIRRHESFRTSFHEKNAQPVQMVHDDAPFSIQKLAARANMNDIIKEFLQPFDLTQAPLLRIGLATLKPGKYLLLADMHHIISDGVSLAVFTADLIRLYHGEALPPLKIQYKDFVGWQQESFRSGLMNQQEHFWLRQFSSGVPVLDLHTDRPRPAVQSFNGDKLLFELTREQVQKIHSLAADAGATPFMLLLAVYNILLHKYTGQEDIAVGSPIAGRSHNDLDNIVGMFVNTLVLRNKPAKGKTFLQFLSEVKENSLNAYEHQDYPFALLVDKLDLKKDASRNPLFDVLFVLQNFEIQEMQLNNLTITGYPVNTGSAQFDLLIEINEREESWPVKLEYNTDLFEEDSILLMKERFIALLQDIFADPTRTIEELSIRIAAETINKTADLDIAFAF
jgi:3-oxoacyl-(acyl-carrier-protein) synthase/acyl carrier protein